MYTDPDLQFLAPAQSLEIGQDSRMSVFFRCADLATLKGDSVELREVVTVGDVYFYFIWYRLTLAHPRYLEIGHQRSFVVVVVVVVVVTELEEKTLRSCVSSLLLILLVVLQFD